MIHEDNTLKTTHIGHLINVLLFTEPASVTAACPAVPVDIVRTHLRFDSNQPPATTLLHPAAAPDQGNNSDKLFGKLDLILLCHANNSDRITILETRPVPPPEPASTSIAKAVDEPPGEEEESEVSDAKTEELSSTNEPHVDKLNNKYK